MIAPEYTPPSNRLCLAARAWLLVMALCLVGDSTRALLCAVHDEAQDAVALVSSQPIVQSPQSDLQDCLFCVGCTRCGSCCATSSAVASRTVPAVLAARTQAIVPRWRIRSLLADHLAPEFLRPPIAA